MRITRGVPTRSKPGWWLPAVALAVALTASGCAGTKSNGTVASHLTMGGPPECPTRITCLLGLEQIYGLQFKGFKALDEVGPRSVAALADDKVQVVRLDSSDPNIAKHGWVILQDTLGFQQAGNIIPAIRISAATPAVTTLLDKISASMTQADLIELDTEVELDGQTSQAAASRYVQQGGLGATGTAGSEGSITVGSANFSEAETLAYIYIDALRGAGFTVTAKIDIGSRENYEPELESGQIDLVPEYVGNYLSFLESTVSSPPLATSVTMLRSLLAPKGVTVLDPSSAFDADAIVVTQATADKYKLTGIADLGSKYPG